MQSSSIGDAGGTRVAGQLLDCCLVVTVQVHPHKPRFRALGHQGNGLDLVWAMCSRDNSAAQHGMQHTTYSRPAGRAGALLSNLKMR